MKGIFIIILLIFSISVNGQEETDFINKFEYPEGLKDILKTEDFSNKYSEYDFSTILTPKTDFIGYIGDTYRRIYMYFTSIEKNTENSKEYLIKGISRVGNNVCDFEGKIEILQIRERKFINLGLDEMYKDEGFKAQGILFGKYQFNEDLNQNHSGTFEGYVASYWYVDRFGIMHYDNISWYSDSFRNNQYVGIWREYKNENSKVCNWGEYRIPFSGDLDIGAAEFSANPKYKEMGWNIIGEK